MHLELTEQIPLSDSTGYIPCSCEYMTALTERNAIYRPTREQPSYDHLDSDERRRWLDLNGKLDQLQWQGGHIGATVWFEPPGIQPHGWAILQKRDKRDGRVSGEQDGQWHTFRYITATGDNGEPERGLVYAFEAVRQFRKTFKEWADRREKPHDTQYMIVACYPVDEYGLAAAIAPEEKVANTSR